MGIIPGLPDPQALNPTTHRRQYLDFRVIVYRLRFPDGQDKIQVPGVSGEIDLNDVLAKDFGDVVYQDISGKLNKLADPKSKAVFISFLEKFNERLKSVLTDGGVIRNSDDLAGSGIFQEIDITPIVLNVVTQMSLSSPNTCSIACLDPYISGFGEAEINRFIQTASLPSPTFKKGSSAFADLNLFQFREFDLVRVFAAASIEKTNRQRVADMKAKLGGLGVPTTDLDRFAMRPIFTGFVAQIGETNGPDGVATLNVSCLGVQRMFMQSMTVFSEALASVVSEASPELGILKSTFSAFSNNFTGMSVDQIIKKIFTDYLHPLYLPSPRSLAAVNAIPDGIRSPDLTPDTGVGIPEMSTLLKALSISDSDKVVPNLIPMLPSVVLLHLLKSKFREPILTFDDRMSSPTLYIADSDDSPGTDTVVAKDPSSLPTVLQPYLDMARDTFASFNSSYSSASEIFDNIRQITFMELFEDKTGQFHFRFPRYNHATVFHDIEVADMVGSFLSKDDSAVYTANVSQPMIPFVGATEAIGGQVFIDKLSVLRYGFRRPQTLENPNSVSPTFAAALARFMRDYQAGMASRTARIDIVGRTEINVGDMVIFRTARRSRVSDSRDAKRMKAPETAVKTRVGYVVGLSDRISVSDRYVQTLDLAFVRDASSWAFGDKGGTVDMSATLWDVAALDVAKFAPGSSVAGVEDGLGSSILEDESPISQLSPESSNSQSTGFDPDISLIPSTIPVAPAPPSADKFLPTVSVRSRSLFTARFRFVRSAIELAAAACDPQVLSEVASYGAMHDKGPSRTGQPTAVEIDKHIRSTTIQMNDQLIKLAIWKRMSGILNSFSQDVKQFATNIAFARQNGKGTAFLRESADRLQAKFEMISAATTTSANESVTFNVKTGAKTQSVPLTEAQRKAAAVSFDALLKMVGDAAKADPPFTYVWTLYFRGPSGSDVILSEAAHKQATAAANTLADIIPVLAKKLKEKAASDTTMDTLYRRIDDYTEMKRVAQQQAAKRKTPVKPPSPLAGLGKQVKPDTESIRQT